MNYPNHTVKAVILFKKQRCHTPKIKFTARENIEEDAKKAVQNYFNDPKLQVLETEIKPLKAPKLGAKQTKTHDYVRLLANFQDGTLRLTTSFRRISVSGDFLRNPETTKLMEAINAYEKRENTNIVKRFDELTDLANQSKEYKEFTKKAVSLLTPSKP